RPACLWLGRREHRHDRIAVGRPEHDAHALADAYALGVAVDDVGEHRRAFIEGDVGDDERAADAHDAVGIDGARAGAGLPFGALAEAVRTDRARVEMRLATVAAAPDEELAFRGGVEVGLDLGIEERCRDRTHSRTGFSGHSRHSLSRMSVALPWRDDSTPPMP